MATRRPLFFNQTDFSPEEMAHADDIHIGKIVLDGVGGVAIDGGHNLASNFATPLTADDLATKGYVDAVASGLDPHTACIVRTVSGLGTQAVLSGTGGVWSGAITTQTMEVKVDGDAAWTTITFATPANIVAVASAINTQYGAVIAFVNGANIDLKSLWTGKNATVLTQNVHATITSEVGIPNNGDADGTGFVAAGTGVGKTLTAPTSAVGFNTIDGHLLVANERVCVAAEAGSDATADIDNGVYFVSLVGDGGTDKFTLTRATDADQGTATEMHQGLYVFIVDGTTYINTGWDVITVDPITVDTTPIKWGQFSGAPAYTYDQGLKRVISSIQVDLDTGANAQGTGAAGGSSGLEFDADTASGKLRAKVDPVKGITRNANGLGILLNGTTLEFEGSNPTTGLRVKGLPNLFEIGGSATSQTPGAGQVTATNLNTLTAGSSSNADALHTHASAPATEAPLVETDWLAGAAGVTQYYPVYVSTTNNSVLNGDTDTDVKCAVIGIAAVTQTSGLPVAVDSVGLKTGALTGLGFVAGDRIYLKTGGGLANAAPGAGKRVVEMGFAKNSTDLFLKIVDRGRRAA
jgi:hypothetical protein